MTTLIRNVACLLLGSCLALIPARILVPEFAQLPWLSLDATWPPYALLPVWLVLGMAHFRALWSASFEAQHHGEEPRATQLLTGIKARGQTLWRARRGLHLITVTRELLRLELSMRAGWRGREPTLARALARRAGIAEQAVDEALSGTVTRAKRRFIHNVQILQTTSNF